MVRVYIDKMEQASFTYFCVLRPFMPLAYHGLTLLKFECCLEAQGGSDQASVTLHNRGRSLTIHPTSSKQSYRLAGIGKPVSERFFKQREIFQKAACSYLAPLQKTDVQKRTMTISFIGMSGIVFIKVCQGYINLFNISRTVTKVSQIHHLHGTGLFILKLFYKESYTISFSIIYCFGYRQISKSQTDKHISLVTAVKEDGFNVTD